MEQSGNIKPNKYNHGKIYKLVDNLGFYYVGSTCSSLAKRLSEHRRKSKVYPNRKVYKQITNWDDITIVLIVEVNVENKDLLVREENKHIDRTDPFCLNSYKAFLTEDQKEHYNQQYRNENKEKLLQYMQQYYNENKEKIQQQHHEYYNENKEKIQQRHHEYNNKNKEKIQQQQHEYYNANKEKWNQLIKCVCGSEINIEHFKRHKRSQKHQQYIKDHEQETVSL